MADIFNGVEKDAINHCVKKLQEGFPDIEWEVAKRDNSICLLLRVDEQTFEDSAFLTIYGDLYKNYIIPKKLRFYIIREAKKE
jgi:hypothetical protein